MNLTGGRRARRTVAAVLSVAAAIVVGLGSAQAQTSSSSGTGQAGQAAPGTAAATPASNAALATASAASYDNRWEVYGGLNYSNGQAGQVLPKHYNMGGFEGMGTYWLTKKLGVAADYRWQGGTTPVEPDGAAYGYNRVAVYQQIFMGGVQYRGPRNRYAAADLHGFFGGDYGKYNSATNGYPGGSPLASCPAQQTATQQGNIGLYCNHIAPFAALGASVDFNYSPKVAIRLQPDLILEHFGTEEREFFSISMGLVYRIGKRK